MRAVALPRKASACTTRFQRSSQVNLIHSEGRPMPGLLYEAEIKATHKNSPNYTNGSFYTAHNLQAAHGAGVYKAPLYTSQTAPIVYAIPVAGASTNLARQQVVFENQLLEFCRDYNSPHSDHVATVAKQYLHKQQECWQLLYTKYNVSYIRSNRSYPSYAEVFDGTPMPDLDTLADSCFDIVDHVVKGLAITMYLLGHFNALPALPISILLGVSAFFWMAQMANDYLAFLVFRGVC
ncbi:hypothetical protein DYB32_001988 [Aphanomyces invadans]|uniref:Uncharacterized protein n=1 Tax=Aphanomyces invadans TaxID=157072 RepID=A0A418B4I5_9STRA|nr:hypothetical protein DYB32_001988 [Aphanomyces invadans]